MTDEWFAPDHRPAPSVRRPAERLWEFRRADHHTFACEMRFEGESLGWDVLILEDGNLLIGRRFMFHEEALAWAASERQAIEKDWE